MAVLFEVDVPPSDSSLTGVASSVEKPPAQTESSSSCENNLSIQKVWKVSQLTQQIRLLLEANFRSVVLEGELSNCKKSTQGHLYLVLKDPKSQIRGVMFRPSAQYLKFTPEDGLDVVVHAQLTVYSPRGEYQLNISSMEPKGVGALQFAFEQLKKKLHSEGLFNQEHKQKIPYLPRKIGIVTSPTGAVIHDMLTVLQRRFPGIPVLLYPAAVQGEHAASQIIAGIQYLNQLRDSQSIDVLIIGRGGGSIEDLWGFNDEALARTIFSSSIPIISAVGHETDFTIADFVSDLRAPTPSAAMELAVPSKAELLQTVTYYSERLQHVMAKQFTALHEKIGRITQQLHNPSAVIHQYIQRVDDISSLLQVRFSSRVDSLRQNYSNQLAKLSLLNPKRDFYLSQTHVDSLQHRLIRAMENKHSMLQEKYQKQIELLDSLSPLTVMKRGYSILVNAEGKQLDSVEQISVGDIISARLQNGLLETQVIRKQKN